ncbi:MAG: hypothetical protein Q9M30_00390 [Mariprofundaceae bacterium]|nr:hypothetical protein [Mariprofundaceae bacterium]
MQGITLKYRTATSINLLLLFIFLGTVVYCVSVLKEPALQVLAGPEYWKMVAIAVIAVGLLGSYRFRNEVTSIEFSADTVRIHHMISPAIHFPYDDLHSIWLDADDNEVSFDALPDGKLRHHDCPASPGEQEQLKALLLKHGFVARPDNDKPTVALLRPTDSEKAG